MKFRRPIMAYAIVAALLICGCSFDEARQMQQRAYLDATRLLPANVLLDIKTIIETRKEESMQTHDDYSHDVRTGYGHSVSGIPEGVNEKMKQEMMVDMANLEKRAAQMTAAGLSQITAGRGEEEVIEEYDFKSVRVRKLPDDQDGVLRISVGGGETEEGPINYCVYRGDKNRCIRAMKRALNAMERGG